MEKSVINILIYSEIMKFHSKILDSKLIVLKALNTKANYIVEMYFRNILSHVKQIQLNFTEFEMKIK